MSISYILTTCLALEFPDIVWRQDINIPAPGLIFPYQNRTFCIARDGMDTGICLSWTAVPGATTYLLQWSLNQDFSGPTTQEFVTSGTEYCLQYLLDIRQGTEIYWRVIAANQVTGGVSTKSEVRQFRYDCGNNTPDSFTGCEQHAVSQEIVGRNTLACCDYANFSLERTFDCPEFPPQSVINVQSVKWCVRHADGQIDSDEDQPDKDANAPVRLITDTDNADSADNNINTLGLHLNLTRTQTIELCAKTTFEFSFPVDGVEQEDFECETCTKIFVDCNALPNKICDCIIWKDAEGNEQQPDAPSFILANFNYNIVATEDITIGESGNFTVRGLPSNDGLTPCVELENSLARDIQEGEQLLLINTLDCDPCISECLSCCDKRTLWLCVNDQTFEITTENGFALVDACDGCDVLFQVGETRIAEDCSYAEHDVIATFTCGENIEVGTQTIRFDCGQRHDPTPLPLLFQGNAPCELDILASNCEFDCGCEFDGLFVCESQFRLVNVEITSQDSNSTSYTYDIECIASGEVQINNPPVTLSCTQPECFIAPLSFSENEPCGELSEVVITNDSNLCTDCPNRDIFICSENLEFVDLVTTMNCGSTEVVHEFSLRCTLDIDGPVIGPYTVVFDCTQEECQILESGFLSETDSECYLEAKDGIAVVNSMDLCSCDFTEFFTGHDTDLYSIGMLRAIFNANKTITQSFHVFCNEDNSAGTNPLADSFEDDTIFTVTLPCNQLICEKVSVEFSNACDSFDMLVGNDERCACPQIPGIDFDCLPCRPEELEDKNLVYRDGCLITTEVCPVVLQGCLTGRIVNVVNIPVGGTTSDGIPRRLLDLEGSTVALGNLPFLDEDCWQIMGKGDCAPLFCPNICAILDCPQCAQCVQLIPCNTSLPPITTEISSICNDSGIPIENLDVVLLDDDECYTVVFGAACENVQEVNVVQPIQTCLDCSGCYNLTPCFGTFGVPFQLFRDNHNFSEGQIIRVDGICFTVGAESGSCLFAQRVSESRIETDFADCAECGCWMLTPCETNDTSDPIVATFLVGHEDLVSGATVMLSDFTCWVAEPFGGDCVDALEVELLEVFEEECGCQCYLISECEFPTVERVTYSDLSELVTNQVFNTPDGICYRFLRETPCEPTAIGVVINERFSAETNACDCCLVPKYSLTPACSACSSNCGGGGGSDGASLITDTDLSSFVGRLVKYEGDCYLVQESQEASTISDITVTGPFSGCDECEQECISVVVAVRIENNQLVMDTQEVVILKSCGESTEVIVDLDPCEE